MCPSSLSNMWKKTAGPSSAAGMRALKAGPFAPRKNQQGFILIAVLWVTLLLSVFALNYAVTSRLNAQRAMTSERLMVEAHVLRSAVARAEHNLRKYLANRERLELLAESSPEDEALEAERHLFYPRYEAHALEVDDFSVEVRMVWETGKWNVNTISPALLERVLTACGMQIGVEMTRVMDAVQDWIDADDLRRMEGAETPYYMSLEHPYPAKNAPMESIEELLLVRGIDGDLFHGTEEHAGLIDFLTVFGQGERMDINSASPRSMLVVGEISEETVEAVIQARMSGRIKQMSDLAPVVEPRDYELLTRYFDVLQAGRVAIEARVVDPDTGRPGRPLRVELNL